MAEEYDADDAVEEDEQYDSEYTLEECTEYSFYEDDERCFHMGAEEEDYEGLPCLQEVENSDSESESEFCFDEADDELSPSKMVGDSSESNSESGYDLDLFDADSCFEDDELDKSVSTPSKKKSRLKRLPTPEEMGLFGVCDDYSDEEFITEKDIDDLAKEMAQCLLATHEPELVVEYFAAVKEHIQDDAGSKMSQKRGVYIKRSRQSRPRPARTKAENFCLTAYVNVNGHAAFTLFDSGCTTEACSPDFARVAGIKVFPIKSEVTLQLGTAGSRSKINHGATAEIGYDDIKSEEYLDIVNLDQFDLIVGTKFMRKHKMSLDFQYNTIRVAGVPAPTLSEKEECSEVERRNAARRLERETRH
jgi:hypothetical protein